MKAVINGIEFTGGKLVATVPFFFSPDEAGYDECNKDVLDADGKPTGDKKLEPFYILTSDIMPTTTKKVLRDVIKGRLDEFKEAHTRLDKIADWVGTEIEA